MEPDEIVVLVFAVLLEIGWWYLLWGCPD